MKYLGKITDNKDLVTKEYVDTADSTKQATLVSGTNIKTINNQSLLGSGDLVVGGGSLNGISNDSNDNIVIDNSLYVNGHSSAIGTIVENSTSTTTSVTASTTKNLLSIALSIGVWVVVGTATIASASGNRSVGLALSSSATGMNNQFTSNNNFRTDYYRNTTGSFVFSVTGVFNIGSNTPTTCYLNINTNVATSTSFQGIRAVRIA